MLSVLVLAVFAVNALYLWTLCRVARDADERALSPYEQWRLGQ